MTEPLLESDVAESRIAPRNQRAFRELGPEIPRVGIGDNLPWVVVRVEALPDQFVETELCGPPASTVPFTGTPTATLATAVATSSAAIG